MQDFRKILWLFSLTYQIYRLPFIWSSLKVSQRAISQQIFLHRINEESFVCMAKPRSGDC